MRFSVKHVGYAGSRPNLAYYVSAYSGSLAKVYWIVFGIQFMVEFTIHYRAKYDIYWFIKESRAFNTK
jgi:hypothetical protein